MPSLVVLAKKEHCSLRAGAIHPLVTQGPKKPSRIRVNLLATKSSLLLIQLFFLQDLLALSNI